MFFAKVTMGIGRKNFVKFGSSILWREQILQVLNKEKDLWNSWNSDGSEACDVFAAEE